MNETKLTDSHLDRTAKGREKARAKILAETPRWYNPWMHLASTTGVGLTVLAIALYNMHDVSSLELIVIPVVFLIANAFEWTVHKYVLHRRFWPFEVMYVKHTPEHHGAYMTDDMAIRSTKEFRLVLIPAAGVLGQALTAAPLAFLFGQLLSPNSGWLFLVTSSLYMVAYELSHLSYHLRADSFIGRMRIVRVLREHHATHHDPRLMQKWNFNVTIPLFDWILGTIVPRSEIERLGSVTTEN